MAFEDRSKKDHENTFPDYLQVLCYFLIEMTFKPTRVKGLTEIIDHVEE